MKYNVRKEWLVDENNSIVIKPLSFWFEYFGIIPSLVFDENGKGYEMFAIKKNAPHAEQFITLQYHGYTLNHTNYKLHMNDTFRTGNADFHIKLVDATI